MGEADQPEFAAFLKEFQGETDRGAALVGAALLDQKLSDILRAFLVEGRITDSLLEGGNAPLGTFSARIKAAFALGLIDRHEQHECEIIRKVRNEFAHRIHGTTFKEQRIAAWCAALQSDLPAGPEAFKDNPRGMFINAVVATVLRLTFRAKRVSGEKRSTRTWPY
jgi:mannitol operon repressor